MTLPLPQLDTRTYDSLVSDALTLLPRYAPDWTDHNTHDPGITLIELFAWLAEMDLYRLDRVTEASTRAFLRLLGIEPKPAQVAETVFVLARKAIGPALFIPARTKVAASDRAVTFQTMRPVWVSSAKLVAVLAGPQGALTDYTNDNAPTSKRFLPFGPDPQPGDALYLGFDQKLADAPASISLYIWTGEPEQDHRTREALEAESKTIAEEAKFCPSAAMPDWRLHYSVRTVWEYFAGSGQWLPLLEVTDETRGLTLSGAVSFKAPPPAKHVPVALSGHATSYFIRCRIVSGSYDCPPYIRFVQHNTVLAQHTVDLNKLQQFGVSNGRAGQIFALPDKPIMPGSTKLEIRVGNAIEPDWKEHLSWDRVGPHDRGYMLDPVRGEVSFGNGRTGAVPRAGAKLFITHQIGGGPTGNVPEGTKWSSAFDSSVSLAQPFAAHGGTHAESLFDAKARAVAWLSEPHRAVTLRDFEQLALATPGVPIARATALADYDPKLTCVAAPGSVTVIVIAKCAERHFVPGPDLLRAVEQYLERRRLLTTEVHVIGPEFTKVAVHATLHVTPESSPKELIARANDSLNQFFDPISGGQDGNGWPMGRAVYRSEILARLNALPGVIYVDEINLETVLVPTNPECDCCHKQEKTIPAQCGNIEICPHGLVTSGQYQIKVLIERAV
jgi:predicted phage baseplate assembly protein